MYNITLDRNTKEQTVLILASRRPDEEHWRLLRRKLFEITSNNV